jgi:two-component system response regulator (stage 0 sporulation protein F)
VTKTRILVVDDDPALTRLVMDVLCAWGCETASAAGAGEAVGLLTLRSFDLVLTDLHMHVGNGFELLKEIRTGWPGTAVILMSSFPSPDTVSEALEAGAVAFLSKPFSLDELREVLDLLPTPTA